MNRQPGQGRQGYGLMNASSNLDGPGCFWDRNTHSLRSILRLPSATFSALAYNGLGYWRISTPCVGILNSLPFTHSRFPCKCMNETITQARGNNGLGGWRGHQWASERS